MTNQAETTIVSRSVSGRHAAFDALDRADVGDERLTERQIAHRLGGAHLVAWQRRETEDYYRRLWGGPLP